MQGLTGKSCNEHDNENVAINVFRSGDKTCINKCSGRGKCLAGYCKCDPGHWGMDCGRSVAYVPDPASPSEACSTAAVKIYRYELPWYLAFPTEQDDGFPFYDHMYSAEDRFSEALARDVAVLTENPHEANLFYVPMLAIYMNNQDASGRRLHHIMDYIHTTYPALWGRHHGRDHFVFLTHDHGACYVHAEDELSEAPIKMVHFGLEVGIDAYTAMPGRHPATNPRYGCFLGARDVLIPHPIDNHTFELGPEYHQRLVDETANDTPPRQNLFFFGGALRLGDPTYSGGARQTLHEFVLARNDSRVKYGGPVEEYTRASFCFNPYGDGWGSRLPHILLGGCVPVTVQDYTHQAFDDIIPYDDIGLQLRVSEIPRLLDTLQAIPQSRILEYRRAALKYYRAFYWYRDGQAYDYTIASLHKRLSHGFHPSPAHAHNATL
ncbi:hypothetical protein FOA52_016042 [Chlamydomonas sp. UWO 241]|nr:hypothetical protein FOA52_016042 [Chlamydomonas sp. UWO 241]